MSERTARGAPSGLLIGLGVVLVAVSAVSSVTRRAVLFPDNFADHLAASLADERVAAFAADRLTDAALETNPDLIAFRPLVLATARGAVSSSGFQALVRAGARSAHATLFSERGQSVILSVPDVGVLLRSALAKANPALAAKVPPKVEGIVGSIGTRGVDRFVVRLSQVARRSAWLTVALFVAGGAAAVAGVLLAPVRRRALVRLGRDLLVAGIALALLLPAGRLVLATLLEGELAGAAAAGLWDAFFGALRTWGLVLGAIGLVLMAAGRSLLERFDPQAAGGRLVAWVRTPPADLRARLLRGLALLAAGVLAVVRPADAIATVIALVGGGLAFVGLREIFESVLRAAPEPDVVRAPAATPSGTRRGAAVLLVVAALVAGIVVVGRPAPAARRETGACNGAPELCGRAFDAVVFPATHNAMSAADIPDWLFPQQQKGIAHQLQDGVRGFLLDVHYGIPVEGAVKTDLDSDLGSRDKFDEAVGKEGVDAAMRIRDRLSGKTQGPRGLYLCHGFCELGATAFVDALGAIHEFLVENPEEVLVLAIEDYASPQDIAAAFAASGLDGLVYRGPARKPWPTLRELIDSRQRVVVLLESDRTDVSWLHPAYQGLLQETPFRFTQPSEMSCAPNRGGTAGSLFLMNNWIDTTPRPKPSNAAIVNAYDALLARARSCQKERGLLPNLLAVDFYATGDLFRVARTLNGLR
jgi:hypothetical protein